MSLTRFSERSGFLNLVWVGEDGGHRGQLPENRHNLGMQRYAALDSGS